FHRRRRECAGQILLPVRQRRADGDDPREVMEAAMNLLSVVIPVKDEHDNVGPLAEDLREALRGLPWEAIFVDDGSRDGTPTKLAALAAADSRIKVVRLRRCF